MVEDSDKLKKTKIDDDDEMDPKMEKIILFGGIIAIVVLAIVIIFLVVKGFNLLGKDDKGIVLNKSSSSILDEKEESKNSGVKVEDKNGEKKENEENKSDLTEMVTVPELKGKTVAEAIELLRASGITSYRFENEVSTEFKRDTIISVKPEIGTEIRKNEDLVLVVSSGEKLISIPEVKDIPKNVAISTLQGMKFAVTVEETFSDEITEGAVIGTRPAFGSSVREGENITLLVSKGPEVKKAVVPDLMGKKEAEANALLEGAKLKSKVTYEDNEKEAGTVIKQGIKAGDEIAEGSVISIVVSNGPKKKIIYTSSVTIDANPFAEEGESGKVEIKLDQDGKTSIIYSATVSFEDFPLEIDGVQGASESEGTCYMYVDGELYTDKFWTISSWNKAEVDE